MLDKTNSVLDDISATIGYTATNALVDLLGGRTLFVPSTVIEGHYLEKVIGKSALRELVKEFGNSHIYIPEGKWRDVDRKSRRVAMLFVSGKKTLEVATIIGISHVRARQIYVELEEAGLLPVVGEAREIVLRNTGGSETSPENS